MMEEEGGDDEEAASPAQLVGQEPEEHREDDAGDRRSRVGQGESQRTIAIHPRAQSHEGGDVRRRTTDETDDALAICKEKSHLWLHIKLCRKD